MESNWPDFIPFHFPSIGAEEEAEVCATLRSGWLTTGSRTAQFESEFSNYVEAPHALAVNSCTAALHLALVATGIGPGDEVITTPLTFCATVNCILHVGATPVLADVLEDGNLDPRSVEARITSRTRALLPVHFAGEPCNMDDLWTIADRHGLVVIEDAAHAVGSRWRSVPIGGAHPQTKQKSHAVAYSFYATKNLTTGEGGMVTTHDPELAARMRCLCLHGISRDAWKRYTKSGSWRYDVLECGFKYNLSDLQSAIGIWQLRKQEAFLQRRRQLAHMYQQGLAGLDEVELPTEAPLGSHAWHLYVLKLRTERLSISRDEFVEELRTRNIGASVHFIPITLLKFFEAYASRRENDCPRALAQFPRMVSLPLYPAMTEEQVRYVVRCVRDIVTEHRVQTAAHASV